MHDQNVLLCCLFKKPIFSKALMFPDSWQLWPLTHTKLPGYLCLMEAFRTLHGSSEHTETAQQHWGTTVIYISDERSILMCIYLYNDHHRAFCSPLVDHGDVHAPGHCGFMPGCGNRQCSGIIQHHWVIPRGSWRPGVKLWLQQGSCCESPAVIWESAGCE